MNTCLAVLGLGGGELVMVLVAILILFGAKRIPEFAKGLGQGIKEFKKASSDEAFLNSFIPCPRPFANSGILLAPNKIKMATRTITSSPPPKPNTAKHVFILNTETR